MLLPQVGRQLGKRLEGGTRPPGDVTGQSSQSFRAWPFCLGCSGTARPARSLGEKEETCRRGNRASSWPTSFYGDDATAPKRGQQGHRIQPLCLRPGHTSAPRFWCHRGNFARCPQTTWLAAWGFQTRRSCPTLHLCSHILEVGLEAPRFSFLITSLLTLHFCTTQLVNPF